MNLPIRMIGLATTFFWIFLIVFSLTAAYSAKDLQVSFGQPTPIAKGDKLVFMMPVKVVNKGLYEIGEFSVTSRVVDNDEVEIADGATMISAVKRSEEINVFHNLTFGPSDFAKSNSELLFSDKTLAVNETVGLRLANIIPVQVSKNFTILWRAPLYDFTLENLEFWSYNSTHSRVTIVASFENHAPFIVEGNFDLVLRDAEGKICGSGITAINVLEGSGFRDQLDLYVSQTRAASKGQLEVCFSSELFGYGPWVIPYG